MVKTLIDIPEDFKRELKMACAHMDKTMTEIIVDSVNVYIETAKKTGDYK